SRHRGGGGGRPLELRVMTLARCRLLHPASAHGLEPGASVLSGRRSDLLSYACPGRPWGPASSGLRGSNPPSPGWKPGFPPLGPHPRRRDSRACARRLPPGPIPIPREAEGEGIEPPRDSRPGYRIRNGRISALPALQRANRDRAGRLPECLDDIETSPLTRHGHGASPRLVSSHRALPGREALGVVGHDVVDAGVEA